MYHLVYFLSDSLYRRYTGARDSVPPGASCKSGPRQRVTRRARHRAAAADPQPAARTQAWEIESLSELCIEHLGNNLERGNIADITAVAQRLSLEQLLASCEKYDTANPPEKVRREKLKQKQRKEKVEQEKVKKWEAEREVVVQYVERLQRSLKTGRPRQLSGL
jgi:hypothetical protein